MQFPLYSLKTGVLTHLAFLIVSAMLLINVVMVKFSERDLIQTKLDTASLLSYTLEQKIGNEIIDKNRTWSKLGSDLRFRKAIIRLLRAGGFSEVLIVNREGMKVFTNGSWVKAGKEAISLSRKALGDKKRSFDFKGKTWGVIWLAHERVRISFPLLREGRLFGAMTIGTGLGPLYQQLRKSEKIILIYILLNTIILVFFGSYILSRTVIKPISKLVRITEEFKEGETFPKLVDSSRNEIGQLSRSLHMMIKRLEESKEELRVHISSLEKANREIKKAQNEIIKSEKLASVGRLAAGVAHEIGNPLGIILGYLELLKGDGLNSEERRDFLERTESEIIRINQIIRELLDFSRLSIDERKPTSVHDLLTETINILKPQPMMTHIQIQPNLEASGDIVLADPNQLKQVFLNIIMNAADAMASSELSNRDAAAMTLSIRTLNIEDTIELLFTDSGPGIPEEEVGHIFDPFYTTKEPGKGTGLGLAVCYRIVEELKGTIRAETSPGKGTIIIIDIPLYHTKD